MRRSGGFGAVKIVRTRGKSFIIKPILFQDIDGVLLPFGSVRYDDPKLDKEWDEPTVGFSFEDDRFGTMAVSCPKRIVDAISRLKTYFDIVWCTAWGQNSTKVEPLFGLEGIPSVPFLFDFGAGTMRKGSGILHYLEDNGVRPFAWVDDDGILPWHRGEQDSRWGSTPYPWPDVDKKLVIPDPCIGLTHEHTNDLITWAESLAFGI